MHVVINSVYFINSVVLQKRNSINFTNNFIPRDRQYINSPTMFFFDADAVHLLESVAMVHKLFLLARTVTNSALWCMSWGMWLASGMSTHGPTAMTTSKSYARI
jgi:hypothetical protein